MNTHVMATPAMQIFCLNSSHSYAERVASYLDVDLSPHEERTFGDGEHKTRALVDVERSDVYVIASLFGEPAESIDTKLCKLLFFIGSLKSAGAARVTAMVPYLCYARKDQRTQPHDPITTRYLAAMFEAVGCDAMATIDVHNRAAFENAFRCRSEHLQARALFVEYFSRLSHADDYVVVAPDFGAAKRAEEFRRDLATITHRQITLALMEKYRTGGQVSGTLLTGEVRDKTAIILDDLIGSGGTLLRAAQACRDAGATRIYAAATHGLFSADAMTTLSDAAFEAIVVTDTISPRQSLPSLHYLDSSALIAQAIERLHGR